MNIEQAIADGLAELAPRWREVRGHIQAKMLLLDKVDELGGLLPDDMRKMMELEIRALGLMGMILERAAQEKVPIKEQKP